VVKQMTLGSFTPRTSPNLYIGYRPDTSPFGPIAFVGLIDEVTLYSRALSTNEIQAIYNAGSAGKCVGVQNPLPSLNITRSGTNIILTWPPYATNFSLQVTYTNLSASAIWTNTGAQPILTNNLNVVTLPIDTSSKFFRLYHP